MMQMNSCNFIGKLVEKPRLFTDDEGIERTTFTLAVGSDRFRGSDYLDFVVWGKKAKYVAEKFQKGEILKIIDSRARVRNIVDANGVHKRKTEYVVSGIYRIQKNHEYDEFDFDNTEGKIEDLSNFKLT